MKFAILLVSLFFLISCSNLKVFNKRDIASKNQADEFLGTEREQLFNAYIEEIKRSHVFSKESFSRFESDWGENLSEARTLFINAKDKYDIYYSLLALTNSLRDKHSFLKMNPSFYPKMNRVRLTLNLYTEKRDGKVRFIVSSSGYKKIEKDFILTHVDGEEVESYIEKFKIWYQGNSPESFLLKASGWLTHRNPMWISNDSLKMKQIYTFYNPKSKQYHDQSVRWEESKNNKKKGKKNLEAKKAAISKNCSYNGRYNSEYSKYGSPNFKGINYCVYKINETTSLLRYFSFNYFFHRERDKKRLNETSYFLPEKFKKIEGIKLENKDIDELFKYLTLEGVNNLLIDVRENGGGNISTHLLSYLSPKPFKVLTRKMVFVDSFSNDMEFFDKSLRMASKSMTDLIKEDFEQFPSKKSSRDFPFFCVSKECRLSERIYKPYKNKKMKIVTLVDPFCVSSCDQFVAILKDNHISKLVGLPSSGSHSPFRAEKSFKFVNGDKFRITLTTGIGYRPNGQPLEGNPALVDKYIWVKNSIDYVLKEYF